MKHKLIFCVLMSLAASAHAAPLTVFSTDFNGTLGTTGNTLGGKILLSDTGNTVKLTLNNLPTHTSISLDFLFAAIDSLDGTVTFPSGDYFNVTLDGVSIFRESFANALRDSKLCTANRCSR